MSDAIYDPDGNRVELVADLGRCAATPGSDALHRLYRVRMAEGEERGLLRAYFADDLDCGTGTGEELAEAAYGLPKDAPSPLELSAAREVYEADSYEPAPAPSPADPMANVPALLARTANDLPEVSPGLLDAVADLACKHGYAAVLAALADSAAARKGVAR